MEVNSFDIVVIDVTFQSLYLTCYLKHKEAEYVRVRRLRVLILLFNPFVKAFKLRNTAVQKQLKLHNVVDKYRAKNGINYNVLKMGCYNHNLLKMGCYVTC